MLAESMEWFALEPVKIEGDCEADGRVDEARKTT